MSAVREAGREIARRDILARRFLGVPWLFAVAFSSVGLSIYFALGLVADRGLGLTPLIFLAAGLLFVLTTFTYVEGSAMFLERGGSATFASYGFNELVSFIAGWAILIDYIIVIALAAISVPHYLTPISESLGSEGWEVGIAGGVILVVAAINVAGLTGQKRQAMLTTVALAGALLLAAVVVIGLITSWDPGALTAELDLFSSPTVEDVIYATVIATVAYAGIEAVSNLAPDVKWVPADLRNLVTAGAVVVPLLYVGIAAVALMALPVTPGPGGPETELAGPFLEEPLLGVVEQFEPAWVGDAMELAVLVIAPLALFWAASTAMLGLSRHVYVLARHRLIPSWLGKLGRTRSTPHVAICTGALLAFVLVIPGDVLFLAGVYAFGALIAIAIAHASIIRLRFTDPERKRPYAVPFNVNWRGRRLPVPALVGFVVTALAWVSVLAFHEGALYLGGGWMLLGLVGYVVYRRLVEETSLTKRVEVPEASLKKQKPEFEYERILVPVFDEKQDDEMVGIAGRLADAADMPGVERPRVDVIFVIEQPLSVALDSKPPQAKLEAGEKALRRAEDVASEYDTVDVTTSMVRARTMGAGIVGEARNRGSGAIVMAAELPTRIRGGAVLGGVGGSRPEEIGPVTEYVLRKAPCPVLLTAPPEEKAAPVQD